MKLIKVIVSSALILMTAQSVFAHPGRTASDGCHYCRTNCASWGVPHGQRHCHGGYIETDGSTNILDQITSGNEVDDLLSPVDVDDEVEAVIQESNS